MSALDISVPHLQSCLFQNCAPMQPYGRMSDLNSANLAKITPSSILAS
jgi:hypothetical protein